MAYQCQNFKDGQVLTAECLNKMEKGIEDACSSVKTVNGVAPDENGNVTITISGSGGASLRVAEINLLAANWVGEGNLFSQVVTIDGVTENSQVDLTPSVEQLVIFYEKDLTFVTENENGVVTVYAIGQKPMNDYTIQVTITEVSV
jgi:hypothetical protein